MFATFPIKRTVGNEQIQPKRQLFATPTQNQTKSSQFLLLGYSFLISYVDLPRPREIEGDLTFQRKIERDLGVINHMCYSQFSVALILHSIESIFVHILEFCTMFYKEFIDINSRKVSMIYTQSTYSILAPRLRTTTQFVDSCTKFSSQITSGVIPPR